MSTALLYLCDDRERGCVCVWGGGGDTVTMSGEVAQGCSVSPEMCFADVIWTAVNNSYSEQTGRHMLIVNSNILQP